MWPKRWEVVLLLHHGIGDLVMALPMLKELLQKCTDPSAVLIFVKCNATFRLLEVTGYSTQFTVKIFHRRLAGFYPFILSFRRPMHLIAPQSCGDWRMPLLAKLTLAANSVGPAIKNRWLNFSKTIADNDQLEIHKTEYYLKVLARAGYSSLNPKVDRSIQLPEAIVNSGKDFLKELSQSAKRWYAFTPGSTQREKHKRWPVEHYGRLATMLLSNDADAHILVIGSEEERNLLTLVKQHGLNSDRIHIVTPSDIGLALAIYYYCICVVTGCNGSSHLAGLVGTPLVLIFGPTNPGNTGAWATRRRVLTAKLTCSPCYRLGFLSGCNTPICMVIVTPEEVFREVLDLQVSGGCDPLPWLTDGGAVEPNLVDYTRFERKVSSQKL
jgi:heptosyltransferase-2